MSRRVKNVVIGAADSVKDAVIKNSYQLQHEQQLERIKEANDVLVLKAQEIKTQEEEISKNNLLISQQREEQNKAKMEYVHDLGVLRALVDNNSKIEQEGKDRTACLHNDIALLLGKEEEINGRIDRALSQYALILLSSWSRLSDVESLGAKCVVLDDNLSNMKREYVTLKEDKESYCSMMDKRIAEKEMTIKSLSEDERSIKESIDKNKGILDGITQCINLAENDFTRVSKKLKNIEEKVKKSENVIASVNLKKKKNDEFFSELSNKAKRLGVNIN